MTWLSPVAGWLCKSARCEQKCSDLLLIWVLVSWLVSYLISQQRACVSQGQSMLTATLRKKLQIKLDTSHSHRILTPGQLVLVQVWWCQAPGIFRSLVWLNQGRWRAIPVSVAQEADAFTTVPLRWFFWSSSWSWTIHGFSGVVLDPELFMVCLE